MIRAASLALLVSALAALAPRPARAGLPVAPPPREIRPDGSRDPAPQPQPPAKAEDPAAVVDRIIKNSKDVGDKLARTDTGAGTRKAQGEILSDIDALINRQENPPPKGDKNDQQKDEDKDKQKDKDPMNNQGMPNSGMPMNDTPMGDKGMGGKQGGMPTGGGGDQRPMGGGRRPRMGEGEPKKRPEQPAEKPEPEERKKGGRPKESSGAKNPAGAAGGDKGGKAKEVPSLPFDEDVAKDVWGHLPDRLRRQMTQYYKEDVMPKYSELLRLYYSSLSDRAPGAAAPRK
jgi:hypothetical protein